MKITDEQLSAFLDNELDDEQMALVRDAIAADETLCDRMATLSMVDHVVKRAAEQATTGPVPEHIVALCDSASESNVVSFADRKAEQTAQQPTPISNTRWLRGMAMAASVALVGLLGLQQLMGDQPGDAGQWQQIAAVLDSQTSGSRYSAGDVTVMPQLSFVHQDGALCRQFTVSGQSRNDAVIACKKDGSWQQRTLVPMTPTNGQAGEYQTATSAHELDKVLDTMIKGAPLNREQEQQAIQSNWQQ